MNRRLEVAAIVYIKKVTEFLKRGIFNNDEKEYKSAGLYLYT